MTKPPTARALQRAALRQQSHAREYGERHTAAAVTVVATLASLDASPSPPVYDVAPVQAGGITADADEAAIRAAYHVTIGPAPRMTPARLCAILATLGRSQRNLAHHLDHRSAMRVDLWAQGRRSIPADVAAWLEAAAAWHEANPPPRAATKEPTP